MRVSVNILVALLFSFFSSIGQELKVDMNPNTILIGEPVEVTIQLRVPANDTIAWPDIVAALPDAIEILALGKIDSSFDKNDIRMRELNQQIRFTSFDTGYFPIPSLRFIGSSDTLISEGNVLRVNSIAIDSTTQFAEIYEPLGAPYSFSEFMDDYGWYILIGILLALVIWYVLANLKKWFPPKEVEEKPVVKEIIPAHVIALQRLEEMYNAKVWNQSVKHYYSDLSEVFRTYLEQRFHILALEQTSIEILNALQAHVSAEQKNHIQRILQETDMVKFAKYKPDQSNHEPLLKLCIEMIKATQEKLDYHEGN